MKPEITQTNLFFLYLAAFITIVGFGMVFPLLPFYAQNFGASPSQIGFLAASFSIGQFLAAPIIGRISDRFGRKPVLGAALLGTALSFFLFGQAKSLAWLFLSRTLHGICSAGAFPIASAYIGDTTSKEERVKYMGRLTAMFALGFIVGPAVSGTISSTSLTLPFFLASILSGANSLFIFLFLPESLTKRAERVVLKEGLINIKAIVRGLKSNFGILFFLLFAWAFAISNFQVAFPLFSEEKFNFSGRETGFIFTLTGSITAVVQWFVLPRFIKKFQELLVLIWGVLAMSVGQLLIPASPTVAFLAVFVAISSFGSGLLRPTANAILSKRASGGQGATMGLAFSFESLGRMAGPLSAGILISLFGTPSQFVLTALILLFGLLFLFKNNHVIKEQNV